MDPISQNVRYFRKLRGMTQAELAKAAGTTQYTVSEIELAHREPHPATLRKLAAALGVRVADFYGETEVPKVSAPPSQDKLFNNGKDEERRIHIDYDVCRSALESFCDHWQPALSGKRRLDRQGFEDFKADAASFSVLARVVMQAEQTELGQQYDEEGDPVFYTERSEFGPAVMRFHDLAIRMDEIGKERFGEDVTTDPEMGQLFDLFPKAS